MKKKEKMSFEEWGMVVSAFMDETGFDAKDMARLCDCSSALIYSWRIGRGRPPAKRQRQLISMFDFLVERHRNRLSVYKMVREGS